MDEQFEFPTVNGFPPLWMEQSINGLIIKQPQGIDVGDYLFSYFEYEGDYVFTGYTEMKSAAYVLYGALFSSFVEITPGRLNGTPIGQEIKLGVKKGDKFYKLGYDKVEMLVNGGDDVISDTLIANGHLTLFKIYGCAPTVELEKELKPVPYYFEFYSQAPMMPSTKLNYKDVSVGDVVRIHKFKPRNVSGWSIKLLKGNGQIFTDGYKTLRYKVASGDLIDGDIDIEVTTTNYPYYEGEEHSVFHCDLQLEKASQGGTNFEDLTKREWYYLVKYYLQFSTDGESKINLDYLKKREHWSDKDIPPMKVRLRTTKNKYIPPKTTQTIFTDDVKPKIQFDIENDIEKAYLVVQTIDHGYEWQWSFEKGVVFPEPTQPEPEPEPEPEVNIKQLDASKYDEVLFDGDHAALAIKDGEYVMINKTDVRLSVRLSAVSYDSKGNITKRGIITGSSLNNYQERSKSIHNYYIRTFDGFLFEWHELNDEDDLSGEFKFNVE